jgi:uncharacterized protein (TIGR03435 family)
MYAVRGAPEWSTKENYNVIAPYPAGTAPDRVALMLRNLLVDRFHLVTHVEQETWIGTQKRPDSFRSMKSGLK